MTRSWMWWEKHMRSRKDDQGRAPLSSAQRVQQQESNETLQKRESRNTREGGMEWDITVQQAKRGVEETDARRKRGRKSWIQLSTAVLPSTAFLNETAHSTNQTTHMDYL
ncbi:hypothetical protein DPEC_G00198590 [Dallia pectoralis]|uniref:Uncharacterized protein n=1 Tax=Dallia pectoralis TaxID=75939 RepID=A0ACC2G8K1_DALPE|nr:hypothetical protein DPEC_G00198590 [Dallia pectoralis]